MNPRCETVVIIKIINLNLSEGIYPEIDILNGVHLCPSLVKVINNDYAIIYLLNTTENPVKKIMLLLLKTLLVQINP